MIYNVLYILLAALALGVLIFIHELGHYFVALKEGMKVEVFAIGFGKPIISWTRNGVRWQLCWLPFGGYVKIAGMEKKGDLEPYQIPGGFFSKSPSARIRVALAGPLVNIFTALFLFTVIWMFGGREKPFSEYTHLIGWVDKSSQVYQMGIRPGDQIEKINGRPFTNFNELIYSAFLDGSDPRLQGVEIDYMTGEKKPFTFALDAGKNLEGTKKAQVTLGLLSPASFLIYDPLNGSNPIEGSPLKNVGMQKNDRIVWVDGEIIFSQRQLISLVNEPKTILTVKRGADTFIAKVPRVNMRDLRLTSIVKSEMDDWLFASQLQGKSGSYFFIPYDITQECVVQSSINYIDDNLNETTHATSPRALLDKPLIKNDQIIAVDGEPVANAVDLMRCLQTRKIQMIVQRGQTYPAITWKLADESFLKGVDFQTIDLLSSSIGTEQRKQCEGSLCLLPPIQPKTLDQYPLPEAKREQLAEEYAMQKKQIESLKDPQQREEALKLLEESQQKLVLGIQLQDRPIIYNPSPVRLFFSVCDETWRTIKALFTGYLSPKYMSGPVGIVQAIHHGWSTSVNEALFWMAVISLNLGILNLLPMPVLDGGHICLSIWEKVTKKRIKAKTMERLIIPFIVLMLLFFLYATYNDILRLISKWF
jgi:regulator of sigma E protease